MTSPDLPRSDLIRIESEPALQRVAPGEQAVFAITVENRSDIAQAQSVRVRGLPGDWCRIDFDELRRSFPGEQRSATLIVSVPAGAPASRQSFQVVAASGGEENGVQCTLEVLATAAAPAPEPEPEPEAPPAPPPGVSLAPAEVTWSGEPEDEARVTVAIRNVGSEESEYTFSLDGLGRNWYTLPPKVRIPAGGGVDVQVRLHPPARARAGEFSYTVTVAVTDTPSASAVAHGRLTVPEPAAPPRKAAPPVPPPAPPKEQPPAEPTVPVLPPELSLAPRSAFHFGAGEISAQAIVTVQNKSRLIERYEIKIDGIPEEWYSLSTSELRLDPGASQQVPLRLTPRPGAGFPAGEYAFRIRAAPHRFPDSFAEIGGVLVIAGTAAFDARVAPAQAEGRKEKFKLTLTNVGSVPLSLWMEGSDTEGMCKFKFPPPPNLDPGQEAVVPVWVGTRRNGLLGHPETFDFRLRVSPAGGQSTQARSFEGRLIHRPFLGFRLLGISLFLATLASIVGVVVSLGPPKIADSVTWVGCQFDKDYQKVKGGPVYVKSSCGGASEAQQDEMRNPSSAQNVEATPTVQTTAQASPGACASAYPIAVNGKVTAVSDNIRIRESPGLTATEVGKFSQGDTATVIGEHQCADGLVWWQVRKDAGGQQGWAAEGKDNQPYLQPQ